MKIGILVNSLNQLSNWQLRIIEGIFNDTDLESVLLLNNTVSEDWRLGLWGNSRSKKSKLTGLSKFLLKVQHNLESRYLFKGPDGLANAILNSILDKVTTVNMASADLQYLNFDLLLNLSDADLSEELLTISKHGVWELVFKDNALAVDGPIGFWEVLKQEPVIGASLIAFNSNLQEYTVLATAFFNRHWSMTETATIASEGSVSLLFKYIQKLKNNELRAASVMPINTIATQPNIFNVLRYLSSFYIEFLNKLYEKLAVKVLNRRYECWTIFTGSKGFFSDITSSAVPLKMPKDEFWADPFLFHHNNIDYLFFENYSYTTKRGKISCGVLENNELKDVIDILDLDYHLSFPFIFEEDGEIFLMPESSENKTLEIYRAVDFPVKWETYTTAFEGEAVGDAFFHTDDEQQKWLFLNKQAAKNSPMNSELFIYKVNSLRLNDLVPHKQNPVLIDARVARNGGAIFKYNNELYRPSQRNIDGIYGRALNINKIEKLTINEYQETTVQIIESDFDKELMGIHHLHQCNGKFVFDAAYRYK